MNQLADPQHENLVRFEERASEGAFVFHDGIKRGRNFTKYARPLPHDAIRTSPDLDSKRPHQRRSLPTSGPI